MLGRKWALRRALRALNIDAALSPILNSHRKKIAEVFEEHTPLLQGIRDNIIAHRDQNAALQMLWMKRADAEEIEALGWELLKLTTQTIQVLDQVISEVVQLTGETLQP